MADVQAVPMRAVPSAAVRGTVTRKRVGGIGVARGIAVLAMFAVHLGPDPSDGGTASVLQIAPGRGQALFILLSGVSIALLAGGNDRALGQAMSAAVARILVRAALLVPLGLLLTALGTDITVILTYYALFFLLALPAIRLPVRWLVALAGGARAVRATRVLRAAG
ncbi:MAG: heparan-alpha-glucosaminide N-acetyltransferase domain-containing protein [Mycobacterium leprae]